MAKHITISTIKTEPKRVLLAERDPKHPDGEVFVKSDGKSYKVAETPRVRALLALADDEGNLLVTRGTKSAGEGSLAGDSAVVSSQVIPQAPVNEPGPTAGVPTTEGGDDDGAGESADSDAAAKTSNRRK